MSTFQVERYISGFPWSVRFKLAVRSNGVVIPRDIAGWVFSASASISGSARPPIHLVQGGGIEILDLADASVMLALTEGQTSALGPGRLDLQIVRESPGPRRPVIRASVRQ